MTATVASTISAVQPAATSTAAAAGGTAAAGTAVVGVHPSIVRGSIQELIVNVLDIPSHLTDRSKSDIRMAYAKYRAYLDASKTLSKMATSGTWTHKTTNDDVIEVFFSKSMYFKSHSKVFPLLNRYPAMEKWLQNEDDAPSDHTVWGNSKHTFDNLKKILNAHPPPQSAPSRTKGKKGGRSDSSSPTPMEKPKVDKGKGKNVHQKASSSLIPVEQKKKGSKEKNSKKGVYVE